MEPVWSAKMVSIHRPIAAYRLLVSVSCHPFSPFVCLSTVPRNHTPFDC